MDKKVEILFGPSKNIDSVAVDTFDQVQLENKSNTMLEYDVRNILSVTDVFEAERQGTEVYRIYGGIEYLSLMNGIKDQYTVLSDFFSPYYCEEGGCTFRDLHESFDFYLVRPFTGYTQTSGLGVSYKSNFHYEDGSAIIFVDEDFTSWISSTPSDYPAGWTATVTTGSYAEKTATDQAKLDFGTESFNSVELSKILPATSGNFMVETDIGVYPYPSTYTNDSLKIIAWSNSVQIAVKDLLSPDATSGYRSFTFSTTEAQPITKITISGSTADYNGTKYITMEYFNVYYDTGISGTHIRTFEVIATADDFELDDAGFSKNLFENSKQSFNFNKDIDVSGYVDEFGFPPTELYLYAQYNPSTNGNGESETMRYRKWDSHTGEPELVDFSPTTLSVGDVIQGDKISYYQDTFTQIPYTPSGDSEYYIDTRYDYGGGYRILRWKYNPFIPLRLRYFAEETRRVNISGSSYDQSTNIPYYATDLGNGNYVWRNILQQGYIDPLTGNGVEYPFVNKRRYLFTNAILSVMPDLDHSWTKTVFSSISFGAPTVLNYNPINDNLDDIGKPCQ